MPVIWTACICLTSLFVLVSSEGTVTETTQNYICGELNHVESEYAIRNPDCDHYWSVQDHSIGTYLESTPECHSPCKELSAGRIVLIECVNITLAVICTKDFGPVESRVHFHGKMIPHSLHNPENRAPRARCGVFSAVALVLIACLLWAGWLYKNR